MGKFVVGRAFVGALLFAVLVGLTTTASASHFRYGTLSWRIPDITELLTVEYTWTVGSRSGLQITQGSINMGDGSSVFVRTATAECIGTTNRSGTCRDTTGTDSNDDWVLWKQVFTHTYAAAGTYTAFETS